MFEVLPKRGGGWHPVTGGIDEGEEFLDGAKREVLEETGFHSGAGKWIDLEHHFHFEGRFGLAEEKAYGLILKKAPANPVIDPKEHLAFEWVSLKEALKRTQFDSQRDALKLFSCYLEKP